VHKASRRIFCTPGDGSNQAGIQVPGLQAMPITSLLGISFSATQRHTVTGCLLSSGSRKTHQIPLRHTPASGPRPLTTPTQTHTFLQA
jgi:hypothetical protein